MPKQTKIIREFVDCVVDIHHHIVQIVINEQTGVCGAECTGCCAHKVTHPFNEITGEFDFSEVIPIII